MDLFFKPLIAFFLLGAMVPPLAHAKKHETGFLDRSTTIQSVSYKYEVFVPANWTPHRKWPVILALHGSGERGSDGLLETDVGIGTAIRTDRETFEAIVVMPQCAKGLWWLLPPMDDLAMTALAEAIKEFHGDPHRVYLTGLSMGGYGAWHLAQQHPRTFAALVVICGGIRPSATAQKAIPALVKLTPPDLPKSYLEAAQRVGKVPVWIFHGADDKIIPVTESQRMSEAMKQVGAEVHYTEFPGVGHASWDKAYDEPKLFPWLFSKSLPD